MEVPAGPSITYRVIQPKCDFLAPTYFLYTCTNLKTLWHGDSQHKRVWYYASWPLVVQKYPFELCHEFWTEFQTYWKFPGNPVAGGRQRDWKKCILLLARGLSAVCVAISIVIILDKHLQVFDDGIEQYRVRWQLVVFRENLNVSKSGQTSWHDWEG